MQLLLASVRAGDRAAVFNRFGPRTRAHIEELLASRAQDRRHAHAAPAGSGHRRLGAARLGAGGIAHDQQDGDEAEVEVYSAAGDRQTVHLVTEGKSWKVELPLR